MAEYLQEQLKRMSPGVRRTRRKQIKRKTGGERRQTHRSERKQRILNTASMHHSAA